MNSHGTTSRELAGLRNIVETSKTGPYSLRLAIEGREYDMESVTDAKFAEQMRCAFEEPTES